MRANNNSVPFTSGGGPPQNFPGRAGPTQSSRPNAANLELIKQLPVMEDVERKTVRE